MKNTKERIQYLATNTPLLLRAWNAYSYGSQKQVIGISFAEYGRSVGWQLLKQRKIRGISHLLTPVHITRYFEFAFVASCLLPTAKECLDVSSARLFSLYVSQKYPESNITIINPYRQDIAKTADLISLLNYTNIETVQTDVQGIEASGRLYDTIWSISVIEHINGPYDDSEAIRMLWNMLKPGGRLMITVPVDKKYWIEYRTQPSYELPSEMTDDKYFYQRFYDLSQIENRLIRPIGTTPLQIRWFGEKEQGHFKSYIQNADREGHRVTVDDPRVIADHYQEYRTFAEMPGVGVCGIAFEKPYT